MWIYHGGTGLVQRELLVPPRDGRPIETVGQTELELMLQIRATPSFTMVVLHDRKNNAKRLAARRLVRRELLAGPNAYGNGPLGWLYTYELTERGRTCWLRVKGKR